MKTKQQWEVEFDEKYCRKCRNPKSTQFGKPIDTWFFEEEVTPFEIKAFIHSLRKNDIESLREWAKNYIKYTPDELMELNKDVPSTLQEEAFYGAIGMTKVITDLSSHLSEELKNL